MTKDKVIRCWGEDITKNEVLTKKFLSYIVSKEELKFIYNSLNCDIELDIFEYAEVILNQEKNELILDFYSSDDTEKIVRADKSLFFKLLCN